MADIKCQTCVQYDTMGAVCRNCTEYNKYEANYEEYMRLEDERKDQQIADLKAQVAELRNEVKATNEASILHAQLRIRAEKLVVHKDKVIEVLARELSFARDNDSGKTRQVSEIIEEAEAKAKEQNNG